MDTRSISYAQLIRDRQSFMIAKMGYHDRFDCSTVRIYPISTRVSCRLVANATSTDISKVAPCVSWRGVGTGGAVNREMNELSSYQVWIISLGLGLWTGGLASWSSRTEGVRYLMSR